MGAESLNMANNYVGPKGVAPVMAMVAQKTKLKKLMLQNNEIENISMDTIVRTLSKHPSITHIDLSRNPLSRGAAKKLIHLIQVNPHITKLDLKDTNIHSSKVATIESLLERNRSAAHSAAAAAYKPSPSQSGGNIANPLNGRAA